MLVLRLTLLINFFCLLASCVASNNGCHRQVIQNESLAPINVLSLLSLHLLTVLLTHLLNDHHAEGEGIEDIQELVLREIVVDR